MTEPNATIDTVARTCIASRVRLLNRVVTNLYDDALRPLGLKISQANILFVAAKIGETTPTQVGELLRLEVSTLSRNVDLMRGKGWIEDAPSDDARVRSFRLTVAGRRLVDQAIPLWQQAQERARAMLGDDFVARLADAARQAKGS